MKQHIVILRFSEIGDIAIAAPIVRAYAKANPEVKFTMVSQEKLKPLFENIPNLFFQPIDFSEEKVNLLAVRKETRNILRLHPTHIIDLHNSLSTKYMVTVFKHRGIKSSVIDKGNKEKKQLIKHIEGGYRQLVTSEQRYEKAFLDSGFSNLYVSDTFINSSSHNQFQFRRIGIAPFAKYLGKSWPIAYMQEVVETLSKQDNIKIYLFGATGFESKVLQQWDDSYDNCENIAGKYTLNEELEFIKSLDVMISMDSANMHFASFVGTPVISIWGATHPYAGFYGIGQDPNNAVQIDLPCRPCSIFGNVPCKRFDYACLKNISPKIVLQKIDDYYKK